jgi:hypothetical protein
MWLRFMAIVCTLMVALFRMAEPDTWLGHLFASRFEAAKTGYRTLLHVTDLGEGRSQRKTPLTRHDTGFQEILELAFASAQYVTDYITKEQIGPIETIRFSGGGPLAALGWGSTAEHMFRSPITVQLEDRQGRGPSARLGYAQGDLKERFFMPKLRWWALLAVWVGSIINVLLLPFPISKKSQQPMRDE